MLSECLYSPTMSLNTRACVRGLPAFSSPPRCLYLPYSCLPGTLKLCFWKPICLLAWQSSFCKYKSFNQPGPGKVVYAQEGSSKFRGSWLGNGSTVRRVQKRPQPWLKRWWETEMRSSRKSLSGCRAMERQGLQTRYQWPLTQRDNAWQAYGIPSGLQSASTQRIVPDPSFSQIQSTAKYCHCRLLSCYLLVALSPSILFSHKLQLACSKSQVSFKCCHYRSGPVQEEDVDMIK